MEEFPVYYDSAADRKPHLHYHCAFSCHIAGETGLHAYMHALAQERLNSGSRASVSLATGSSVGASSVVVYLPIYFEVKKSPAKLLG
jgi:hypothetical protein